MAPSPSPICQRHLVGLILAVAADPERTAHRLLVEFGDLAGVLAASKSRLSSIVLDNRIVDTLVIANDAMAHALSRKMAARPLIKDWRALLDHCNFVMARRRTEHFRTIHLCARYRLLADLVVAEGTIDQVCVHPREIVAKALELGSASLILVHNHPGGDPTPSSADIALTRDLASAARTMGIAVLDHLIISASGHSSMRALGLL